MGSHWWSTKPKEGEEKVSYKTESGKHHVSAWKVTGQACGCSESEYELESSLLCSFKLLHPNFFCKCDFLRLVFASYHKTLVLLSIPLLKWLGWIVLSVPNSSSLPYHVIASLWIGHISLNPLTLSLAKWHLLWLMKYWAETSICLFQTGALVASFSQYSRNIFCKRNISQGAIFPLIWIRKWRPKPVWSSGPAWFKKEKASPFGISQRVDHTPMFEWGKHDCFHKPWKFHEYLLYSILTA